jgi:hypothetical protein
MLSGLTVQFGCHAVIINNVATAPDGRNNMRAFLGATLLSLTLTISSATMVMAAVGETSVTPPVETNSITQSAKGRKPPKAVKAPKAAKEVKPAKTAKTAKTASSKSGGTAAGPARFASFVVGSVVGTPVAMVRKTKQEIITATKDLVGDTNNKFLLGAGGILGVPAGIVSGFFEGPVYGVVDAWKGSADEPFSAESFSLGDIK